MKMQKFYFTGIGTVDAFDDVRVVILADETKTKMLSVIIDVMVARQIQMHMNPQQEICKRMLPEVLIQLLSAMGKTSDLQVELYDERDGVYMVRLVRSRFFFSADLRFGDAILFAVITGCPLYCNEQVVARVGLPFEMGSCRQSFPLDTLPVKLLQHSLEEAIQQENYRLAAQIKAELEKRGEDRLSQN